MSKNDEIILWLICFTQCNNAMASGDVVIIYYALFSIVINIIFIIYLIFRVKPIRKTIAYLFVYFLGSVIFWDKVLNSTDDYYFFGFVLLIIVPVLLFGIHKLNKW